ncbi:MAG: SUMF1/EgtB/PvdO family nonheme iron enzyme [Polyangiaceae bacterium]
MIASDCRGGLSILSGLALLNLLLAGCQQRVEAREKPPAPLGTLPAGSAGIASGSASALPIASPSASTPASLASASAAPSANSAADSATASTSSSGFSPAGEPLGIASCPAGEVYIPPTGPNGFQMGRNARGRKDTDRAHKVVLTKGYCLDAAEVTAGDYAKCVDAKVCKEAWKFDPWSTSVKHPDYPINMVSWEKGRKYCEWVGKRFHRGRMGVGCVTGPEATKYPWGNTEPDCTFLDYTPGGAPKSSPGGDHGCHGGGPSAIKTHSCGQ